MYKEQEDTPYVGNARKLMQTGYEGLNRVVPTMDTLNTKTMAGLDANIDAIYNRSVGDFDRDYRDTMGKTMAKAYGQFGTTGNTSSLYRNDMQNLQQQRKLADLQYSKALTRDEMLNSELDRRQNAIGNYKTLYDYGKIPQTYDDKNYELREKTNVDRQYQNDFTEWQTNEKMKESAIKMAVILGSAGVGAVGAGALAGGMGAFGGGIMGAQLGNSLVSPAVTSMTNPNSGMQYKYDIYSGGAPAYAGPDADTLAGLYMMYGGAGSGSTDGGIGDMRNQLSKIFKPQGQTLQQPNGMSEGFLPAWASGGGSNYNPFALNTQQSHDAVNSDFARRIMGGRY